MTHIIINTKQKKGISTVLTTMIIVVAAVVLGAAISLFGTSLFVAGAQQQGMAVTNSYLWFQSNSTAPEIEGAVVVRNTGDKLFAVDTIKVREAIVPFVNWAVSSPSATTSTHVDAKLLWQAGIPATASYDIDGSGPATALTLTQQTGPVSLDPGKAVVIFFQIPSNTVLTSTDIGAAATLTVNAGQLTIIQSITLAKV